MSRRSEAHPECSETRPKSSEPHAELYIAGLRAEIMLSRGEIADDIARGAAVSRLCHASRLAPAQTSHASSSLPV